MYMSQPTYRVIPSFPRYTASSEGFIYGPTGRRLTGCPNAFGYLQVLVYGGGGRKDRKSRRVHQLVCEAFHGVKPEGHQVAHNDGDKLNNRPENLRWATPRENCHDKYQHGRMHQSSGELDGMHKLKTDQVLEIRRRYAAGEAQPVLAKEFGVKQPTISNIITRTTWKHV